MKFMNSFNHFEGQPPEADRKLNTIFPKARVRCIFSLHPKESLWKMLPMTHDPLFHGLKSSDIDLIRKEKGSNALPPPPVRRWYQILGAVINDKTIWVLSAAAAISVIISVVRGENVFEGVGILIAVGIAVGVGFMSEFRSSRAFQALLAESDRMKIKVVRDGKFHVVPADELVVGDLVLMETGDKVPADGTVVKAVELSFDTSTITGESYSMSGELEAKIYRGFSVLSGEGAMVVTAVGRATEMGKIRDALATDPEPTPLQERLSELADRIGLGGTVAAVAIFVALFLRSMLMHSYEFMSPECLQCVLNAFIVAVTIVVVAVPEGLPLAVTLSLALNMRRMARDNNLVRTLAASETLGSVTIIASDKTGTLTLNRMRVSSVWTPEGGEEPGSGKCFRAPDDRLFQLLVAANSTAHLQETAPGRFDYIGNPTEGGLLFWLQDCGHDYIHLRDNAKVLGRRSFSSARKMMSTQVAWDQEHSILLVKGAPERVIERCVDCASSLAGVRRPLAEKREELDRILNQAASRGERVLALAYRFLAADARDYEEDQLTLWGLAIIKDPVRREVADSIARCREAGIRVIMVTGDNPLTARAIAEELGLMAGGGEVWDGMQFEQMSDDEVKRRLPDLRILARSRPNDKFRLVSLLKEAGEVVAVTGDGTNDAPALKKADVGVAMGICGTEVSKEASDVVLLDDNFTSIVKGVLWGRSLHSNIQKFLQFQLTVNVAALTTAFVGALIGGRPPLTAVQLLWVNLIMDTLAAIGLGLEPPEDTLLQKKPRKRTAPLITSSMWFMILGMGLYTFASLMVLFRWNFLGEGTRYSAEHLSVIFTTFVFLQVFNELNARSLSGHESAFHQLHRSRGFLTILALICLVQVLLTQFGGRLFQTTPLSPATWLRVLAFASTALLVGAFLRLLMRRLGVGDSPAAGSAPAAAPAGDA